MKGGYAKRIVLYTLLAILVLAAGVLYLLFTTPVPMSDTSQVVEQTTNEVATSTAFRYEVVSTRDAMEQGLGGRIDIPPNYGMLFVFASSSTPGFWMKDMFVPIDIIWLKDNGTILSILPNVSPSSYPHVFYAPAPVKYVLETRAGEAEVQGWKAGTRIELPRE